jgi:O-succinylbenzoate synthase
MAAAGINWSIAHMAVIDIERVTLREIRMRLTEPFRISSGTTHDRRILLVEVTDRGGHAGWGECVAGETPHYSPETVDTAWLALTRWIIPSMRGRTFPEPADLFHHLTTAIRGHPMARAALEMASWDLYARLQDVPLARLVGGMQSEVPTGISLGLQESPTDLARRAIAAVAAGYKRIKLKIEPHRDHDFVAEVRAAVGPDTLLSVDANAAYQPDDTDALERLDAFGLAMVEQPFDGEDLLGHADLQRRLVTPICLDESITSVARAADAVRLGSAQFINIKPGRVGGHTAARAIHDFAANHRIGVWCGGMLETGIGRAHNVALASLPYFTHPGDLSPSARYWVRDIVTPEWTMTEGRVRVPFDRPGIGVDVDLAFVEEITDRHVAMET